MCTTSVYVSIDTFTNRDTFTEVLLDFCHEGQALGFPSKSIILSSIVSYFNRINE